MHVARQNALIKLIPLFGGRPFDQKKKSANLDLQSKRTKRVDYGEIRIGGRGLRGKGGG